MDGCIYRKFAMCEKNKEEDEKRGISRWCDFYGCEDRHPSNADCIRQMSDEELNKFIDGVMFKSDERNRNIRGTLIRCEFLTWLKQEAEEGK